MRSPAAMDIVQIDGNVACPKRCSSCTRLVAHQPKDKMWEMDLPTFELAVKSMEGWYQPGRVLGLIGGEITLHSQFEKMARRFSELFGGPLAKNGRQPIRDYNNFVQKRLFDRSNGRGLWTSLGPSFYRHIEVIYEVFSHFNVNTHEGDAALHQSNLIHRKDYIAATGISEEQWEINRDRCWLQEGWSATITPKGAFFCEQAAAIDMLYFDGAHGWPIEKGWWQRKPEDFKDQLHLCDYCSLAQPGPSSVDQDEIDIISPENVKMLELVGSPAVKKGRIELYDSSKHTEKRVITTKDNYVQPGGRRVSDEHKSVLPNKISLVVVSVGRGAQLLRTLPNNVHQVDEIVVVTHPEDTGSKVAALASAEKVKLVLSERCFENGDTFNKGKMINDGLSALEPNSDWVVLSDADVFLNPRLPEFLKTHALNPGVLHGVWRMNAKPETIKQYGLEKLFGRERPEEVPDCIDGVPNGYFQLFNRRAHAIRDRWPNVMSESFCSAGGLDSWFMQQWPREKMCVIKDMPVLHIAHAPHLGAQWNGDRRPNTWRQCGMLAPNGVYVPTEDLPEGPLKMRLTETQNGKSVECEILGGQFPSDIVKPAEHGLIFCGEHIGCHVHVAFFFEGDK